MAFPVMSPRGINSLIGTVGAIGTAVGSGVSYYIGSKGNNILKKENNRLKEKLHNKDETYQDIFSNALHKISGDLKNIGQSSLYTMNNNFKNLSQYALDNTKDMRQSALQAVKTHPSLAVIAGGAVLYGLYDQVQKQQKTKKLKSAQKKINDYFK